MVLQQINVSTGQNRRSTTYSKYEFRILEKCHFKTSWEGIVSMVLGQQVDLI